MITVDALRQYGADVDGGLSRCMGNEALYLRLVSTVISDTHFDTLKENIEVGDLSAAFETAHALKGVTGNLSLTPIYEPVVSITELLRTGTDTDYTELLDKILSERDKLAAVCSL